MKKKINRKRLFLKSKKVKNEKKFKYKYIKDKGIKNFIFQHSQKPDIDFSKIKIPSFLEDFSKDEEYFNNSINLPIFNFKVFTDIKKEEEKENQFNFGFNSFLFKKNN